jgi:hypothetical protein
MFKDDDKCEKFTALIAKYPLLFRSDKEMWIDEFKFAIEYLKKHNKRPPENPPEKDIQTLKQWFCNQVQNYNLMVNALRDNDIYVMWEGLVEKYPHLFRSNYKTMLKRREEANK